MPGRYLYGSRGGSLIGGLAASPVKQLAGRQANFLNSYVRQTSDADKDDHGHHTVQAFKA